MRFGKDIHTLKVENVAVTSPRYLVALPQQFFPSSPDIQTNCLFLNLTNARYGYKAIIRQNASEIQACVCMSTGLFFLKHTVGYYKIPMNGVLMQVCTWLEMKTGKKLLDIT